LKARLRRAFLLHHVIQIKGLRRNQDAIKYLAGISLLIFLNKVVYATILMIILYIYSRTKCLVMKILVCISKTPDTTSKIAFKDGNTKFDEAGVQWIINPYDEWYALVRAIELKEKDPSITLHLITVGGADCEPIIRKALALGGDEAIRVNTDNSDSYFIAAQIAEVAKQNGYDLIFTGKETIDYNGSAVAGAIAALLDAPFISLATKFELNGNIAIITREIEGGEETAEVALPVVVSCAKGVAEQRIPNMRGIMAARTKPLKVVEPATIEALTNIVSFELPPAKAGVKMIAADNVAELVRLLHEEAKVI
jgi:electron transfer flavoprotein beta subunit